MAKYKTNKQIAATLVSRGLNGLFDTLSVDALKAEFGFRRLSDRKVAKIQSVGNAVMGKIKTRLDKIAAGRKPKDEVAVAVAPEATAATPA